MKKITIHARGYFEEFDTKIEALAYIDNVIKKKETEILKLKDHYRIGSATETKIGKAKFARKTFPMMDMIKRYREEEIRIMSI